MVVGVAERVIEVEVVVGVEALPPLRPALARSGRLLGSSWGAAAIWLLLAPRAPQAQYSQAIKKARRRLA